MSNTARAPTTWSRLTLLVLIAIGCSSGDDRLVELSRQSVDRQAEQNRLVETNDRQVTEANSKLVQAEAQSRRENLELHRQIVAERTGLNQQRDLLEQERREIADQRNRDPIVAESIRAAAGLVAATLPLVVCLFLLRGLFAGSDDNALADVLIQELAAQMPLLGEDSPNRNGGQEHRLPPADSGKPESADLVLSPRHET
jgi:hypothetical protein